MTKTFLFMLAVILLMPSVAMACMPAPWEGKGYPTVEAVAEKYLFQPSTFLGKVRIQSEEEVEGKTVYTLEVLKQYAGNTATTLVASEPVGTSCALSAEAGNIMLVHLFEASPSSYSINALSNYFYGVPGQEIEAYLDAKQTSGE